MMKKMWQLLPVAGRIVLMYSVIGLLSLATLTEAHVGSSYDVVLFALGAITIVATIDGWGQDAK